MNWLDKLTGRLTAPRLTRGRIVLALTVALAADALQILLPVPPAPEIIDVIAMLLAIWLLGFHLLLLPTFVVEFIPIADMLPTWTACVGAVIALRKHGEKGSPPVIDVKSPPAESEQRTLPPAVVPPPSPPPAHD